MLRTIKPTQTPRPTAARSAKGGGAAGKANKASRAAPVAAIDKPDAADQADGFETGGKAAALFAQAADGQAGGRAATLKGPLAARLQGPQALGNTALQSFGQQLGAVAFANIMATLENPKAMKEAHRHYYEAIRTRLMHLAKLVRMNPALKTPENAERMRDLLDELEDIGTDPDEINELAQLIPVDDERAQSCVEAVYKGRRDELKDCALDVIHEIEHG